MLEIYSPGLGPYTVLICLLILVFYAGATWAISTLRPQHFPPGPPVVPGLGNLHQIPAQKPYLTFHTWAKTYGDLVGLKTGAGNLVVINNPDIVHELFEKRGAIYSNRPISHILTKHVWYEPEDKAIAILQYDEYYVRWRKAFQYILSNAGIKRILPLLEAEACNLCHSFLDDEVDYKNIVLSWSLAVPLAVTRGRRLDSMPPGFVKEFFQTQQDIIQFIIPGVAPLVDFFPILRYLPGFLAKWKSEARRLRSVVTEDALENVHDGRKQYTRSLNDYDSSVRFEGLIAKILREQSLPRTTEGSRMFTDLELGYIGQAAIGAAVDTTVATFESLIYCFAAFPDVLRKAQEEVDRLGGGRPPTGQMLGEMKYLRACISEVLRWRPTTPNALPHTLVRDDRFGDYVFPKGTTFIANIWAFHRNEDNYERPDLFNPERFIKSPHGLRDDDSLEAPENLNNGGRRGLYTFGFGRRQCPGEQFAYTTLMLAASKVIWAFDVLPPPGGVDISIESGFIDGTVTEPTDPKVILKLRSEGRRLPIGKDLARVEAIAKGMLG
ncbi:hypothetical protein VPNG_08251 [Cytospora leucostoma]|uniref:Cytochrome P450 n=1 Tax=Cytospora leucostoma TaxID=1230097 RepID=A0A423WBX7_9PEZI|nr:hypothetical protein VPNG_08251 [Cytospora leucostoma]